MTQRTDHNIWTGLTYDDPIAARAWLLAVGFEEGILVTGSDDALVGSARCCGPKRGGS